MRAAQGAAAGALAALVNTSAAAAWAAAQGRDVAVLCSGEDGAFSLEDAVCAGLVVSRLAAAGRADLSPGAAAALALGQYYGRRLGELRDASRWARRLVRLGRAADVDACLVADSTEMVPMLGPEGIVPALPAGAGSAPPRGDAR